MKIRKDCLLWYHSKHYQMNSIDNIWYLPSENTWKDFQIMAMKDIGSLTIYSHLF